MYVPTEYVWPGAVILKWGDFAHWETFHSVWRNFCCYCYNRGEGVVLRALSE